MYEFKVEEGETLIRRKDRRGRWGKPVVDSKDGFFDSVSSAAAGAKVHAATMARAIEDGREVDGVLYAFATANEVARHCRLANYVETQKDKGVLLEKKPEKPEAPPKPAPTAPPAPAESKATFYGVVWPDGTATIRLATGDFMFSRKRVDDFPAEMRNATHWVVASWE